MKTKKFNIRNWHRPGFNPVTDSINFAGDLARKLDEYLATVSDVIGWFIGPLGFLQVGKNDTFGLFIDGCDARRPVAVFDAANYPDAVHLAVAIIREYNRNS